MASERQYFVTEEGLAALEKELEELRAELAEETKEEKGKAMQKLLRYIGKIAQILCDERPGGGQIH